jgi:hypothetical protein
VAAVPAVTTTEEKTEAAVPVSNQESAAPTTETKETAIAATAPAANPAPAPATG